MSTRVSTSSLRSVRSKSTQRSTGLRRTQTSAPVKARTVRLSSNSLSNRVVDFTIQRKKSRSKSKTKPKAKPVYGKLTPKVSSMGEVMFETSGNHLSSSRSVSFSTKKPVESSARLKPILKQRSRVQRDIKSLFMAIANEDISLSEANSVLFALWEHLNFMSSTPENTEKVHRILARLFLGESSAVFSSKVFGFFTRLLDSYSDARPKRKSTIGSQITNFLLVLWKTCVILPQFVTVCYDNHLEEKLTDFFKDEARSLSEGLPFLVESSFERSKILTHEHIQKLLERSNLLEACIWVLGSMGQTNAPENSTSAVATQHHDSRRNFFSRHVRQLLSQLKLSNVSPEPNEEPLTEEFLAMRQRLIQTDFLTTLGEVYSVYYSAIQLLHRAHKGCNKQSLLNTVHKLSSVTSWAVCSLSTEVSEATIAFYLPSFDTLKKILLNAIGSENETNIVNYVLSSFSQLTWNSPSALEALVGNSSIISLLVEFANHKLFSIRFSSIRILSNLLAGPRNISSAVIESGNDVVTLMKNKGIEFNRKEMEYLSLKLEPVNFLKLCFLAQEALHALSNVVTESEEALEIVFWNENETESFLNDVILLATNVPHPSNIKEHPQVKSAFLLLALAAKSLLLNAVRVSSDKQFSKLLRSGLLDSTVNMLINEECAAFFGEERIQFLSLIGALLSRSFRANITLFDVLSKERLPLVATKIPKTNIAAYILRKNYLSVLEELCFQESNQDVKNALENVIKLIV